MLIFFFTWSCGTSTDSWTYLAGLSPRNSHSLLSSTLWITSSFFLSSPSSLLWISYLMSASDAYTTYTHLFSSSFLLSEEQVKYKKKEEKHTPPSFIHFFFRAICLVTRSIILIFYIFLLFGWKERLIGCCPATRRLNGTCNEGITHTCTPRTSGVTPPRTLIYTLHVWALLSVCVCVWLDCDPAVHCDTQYK